VKKEALLIWYKKRTRESRKDFQTIGSGESVPSMAPGSGQLDSRKRPLVRLTE
jgi:hypothetical protein